MILNKPKVSIRHRIGDLTSDRNIDSDIFDFIAKYYAIGDVSLGRIIRLVNKKIKENTHPPNTPNYINALDLYAILHSLSKVNKIKQRKPIVQYETTIEKFAKILKLYKDGHSTSFIVENVKCHEDQVRYITSAYTERIREHKSKQIVQAEKLENKQIEKESSSERETIFYQELYRRGKVIEINGEYFYIVKIKLSSDDTVVVGQKEVEEEFTLLDEHERQLRNEQLAKLKEDIKKSRMQEVDNNEIEYTETGFAATTTIEINDDNRINYQHEGSDDDIFDEIGRKEEAEKDEEKEKEVKQIKQNIKLNAPSTITDEEKSDRILSVLE